MPKRAQAPANEPLDDDCRRDGQEVLELSIPHKLYRVAVKGTNAKSEFIRAQVGLSINEWKVLLLVGALAPVSTKGIAERSTLDKTKVSRTTTALMAAGLISAERDPDDRRKLDLQLTVRGLEKFRKVVACLRVWDEQLMQAIEGVPPGDLGSMLDQLDRQTDAMRTQHAELAKLI